MSKKSIKFLLLLVCISLMAGFWYRDKGIVKNIAFGNDSLQKLDIYHSKNEENLVRPVLIYVHGGAWRFGDKKRAKKLGMFLRDRGAVVVSVNYRLYPDDKHPAQIEDVATAVHWVKKHISEYGGDPNNLVLAGHSAGAHLVALLTTDKQYLQRYGLSSTMFKAVIPNDASLYDLYHRLQGGKGGWLIHDIIRGNFGEKEAILDLASPLYHVEKNTQLNETPLFHVLVSDKREYALKQSQEFTKALRLRGQQAELMVIEGLTHKEMNQAMYDEKSPVSHILLKSLGLD